MTENPQPAAKPTGMTILAAAWVVVGVTTLYVAYEYFWWMNWRLNYDDAIWAVIDAGLGLAYLASGLLAFTWLSPLWNMQAWVWRDATRLLAALIALDLVSVAIWGLTQSDLIGLIAYGVILGCFNLTPVRAWFGRPPMQLERHPG